MKFLASKGKKFRGWFKSKEQDFAVSAVFKFANERNPASEEDIELDLDELKKAQAESLENIKSKNKSKVKDKSPEVPFEKDEDSNDAPHSNNPAGSGDDNSIENGEKDTAEEFPPPDFNVHSEES